MRLRIEAKGLAPLRPHLDAIAAIKDKKELARALGEDLRADVDALNNTNYHTPNLFGLWVAPGFNDSDHYTPYLMQGGLQLPDREYYVSDSEQMKKMRTQYQTHVSAMLKLAGFSDPDARAARILELEHAIAQTHRTLADNEDIHKANNTWNAGDFAAEGARVGLGRVFSRRRTQPAKQFHRVATGGIHRRVGAGGLHFARHLERLACLHLIEQLRRSTAKGAGGRAFCILRQDTFGCASSSVRAGSVEYSWSMACWATWSAKSMRERYFSPEAKAQAEAMVANLIAAFRKRIEALTWMDPATKAEAEAKLSTPVCRHWISGKLARLFEL